MNSIRKFYAITSLLVAVGYAYLGSLWAGVWSNYSPTLCGFKRVTGFPCPACGSTRGVEGILHGNWHALLEYNPLGLISTLSLVVFSFFITYDFFLGKAFAYRAYHFVEYTLQRKRWLGAMLIGMVLLNWVWNFHKGL